MDMREKSTEGQERKQASFSLVVTGALPDHDPGLGICEGAQNAQFNLHTFTMRIQSLLMDAYGIRDLRISKYVCVHPEKKGTAPRTIKVNIENISRIAGTSATDIIKAFAEKSGFEDPQVEVKWIDSETE